MHQGGCLCGKVRYQIQGELTPIQLCHCSQCRKAQGGPFAANIPVDTGHFHFTVGKEHLRDYESSPGKHRLFCRHCGSPILSRRDSNPEQVRVRAGTLDEPVPARPGLHIFAASGAEWWDIQDDLPQYEALPE